VPYKDRVIGLLMYFQKYKIKIIPKENNMYINDMSIATSLAQIEIENEYTILIIKILVRLSHDYFIEDN